MGFERVRFVGIGGATVEGDRRYALPRYGPADVFVRGLALDRLTRGLAPDHFTRGPAPGKRRGILVHHPATLAVAEIATPAVLPSWRPCAVPTLARS
ncbi:hypothetical protein GCM10022222_50920 [Amycolatopsis ultiminotia]|uniref:Uncharacterized protein n=1 Tax=Amycolatopsis ultiminotia TaxID=543629 RepID=A0ABP6X638_9PSEU